MTLYFGLTQNEDFPKTLEFSVLTSGQSWVTPPVSDKTGMPDTDLPGASV